MSFTIGNIKLKNNIVLAPMAGATDLTYMKICESFGVGLVVTELISAEGLARNNKKTWDMLKDIDTLSIPYAIQLFGSNPSTMAKAAKMVNEKYPKAIIDINMGCPVPKVAIKNNAGSALLKSPELVREIVSEVVKSVNVPVTVKIRSGWDDKTINAPLIAKICEEAGASAIAVHARTRSQGYSGKADWNIIKQVVDVLNIPVIGNGDIKTCFDAKKIIDETGCNAIMIGRGLLGNPWLIKECINYLDNSNYSPKEIVKDEKIEMIKHHFNELIKNKGEKLALLEMRTHAMYYLKGLSNTKELKQAICKCNNKEEFLRLLVDYSIN